MPRTDHIFRNRLQPEHHKQYSLLESLDINMVEQFPTSDPLHLLDLGVMKRCLFQWINGCDEFTSEWSKQQQAQVNEALIQCNKKIPSEFHRSIRSLNYIHVGKGQNTEHSYCTSELLILKKKLSVELYEHFLQLACAATICYCNFYQNYRTIAKQLFDEYIENYISIYGKDSIVSNIHNLTHIIEDVNRFGV